MIGRSWALALILLCLDWSSAVGKHHEGTKRAPKKLKCDPIGRVLSSGDRRFKAGSLVCQGDRLEPVEGGAVEVLCYLNRKILQLSSGVVSAPNKCVPQTTEFNSCTPGNRSNCPKPKAPSQDNNAPRLLSPYSSLILNSRPLLSWYPIAGASSYTVQVDGKGVNWETTVNKTELPYPDVQPAMQFGNVYKVTIIANLSKAHMSASSSALNVLSSNEALQIVATLKRIKNLNLPPEAAAFLDFDAVYMSKQLLNETIEMLKAQVKVSSQNPTLLRLLGDRYLEAGLPEYAKQEYTRATILAQTTNNSAELAKAQAGLRRAELHSQLPTRMNGAQ